MPYRLSAIALGVIFAAIGTYNRFAEKQPVDLGYLFGFVLGQVFGYALLLMGAFWLARWLARTIKVEVIDSFRRPKDPNTRPGD